MKLYLYSIFIIFINYCRGNDNILHPTGKMNFNKINNLNITLYEFSKHPENYLFMQAFQPMGIFKELRNPAISFKKKYKRHTNLALETSNNKKLDFGQTLTFSPLNNFCNSEFEKDNANFCFKYHYYSWDCIYENCISLSRIMSHYISIVLPPIYYDNKTIKQCFILY